MGNLGFNLVDGGPDFFDLLFADDIAIFAQSRVEAGNVLAAKVKQLDRAGLLVNPENVMVITNDAQLPQTITTTAGLTFKVLLRDGGQKWLGSMLTSRRSKFQKVDSQYHRQQASKVQNMNRSTLQDRNVSIVRRLRPFESMVSSVAGFLNGHRILHNRHLERLGTHFQKLFRSTVGPLPGTLHI